MASKAMDPHHRNNSTVHLNTALQLLNMEPPLPNSTGPQLLSKDTNLHLLTRVILRTRGLLHHRGVSCR